MSFITGTVKELLYSMSAPITKNTYTTIAAYTGVAGTNTICSVPAGWFLNSSPNAVGRALEFEVWGTIQNTAAATFANAVNLNATVATSTGNIAINAAYTPTASVVAPFSVKGVITCTAFTTSAMTLQCSGEVKYHSVAAGGAPTTSGQEAGFVGSWTGLDPRLTQYLELFGTWSASSASNSTTVNVFRLYGCN